MNDIRNHILHETLVIAFGHDANDGFCTGRANDKAPGIPKFRLPVVDRALHAEIIQRLIVFVPHILKDLRQRLEAIAHLADWTAALDDHGQDLQRRDKAITRRREIRQNNMPRLLAAHIVSVLAHMLGDVAVADRRSRHAKSEVFDIPLKSEIGHNCRNDTATGEPAAPQPKLADDRHELIAIDDATFFVDNHDSIRVAVQRDPDICSHLFDLADEVLRRGRPAVLIDVEAVGLDTYFDDFGSELPKRFGSNFVGSPHLRSR